MAVRASFRAPSGSVARALEEREAAFAACSGLDFVRDMLVQITEWHVASCDVNWFIGSDSKYSEISKICADH
jgi:hypothetical protein